MKPGKPFLVSPRFFDQLHERMCNLHYSPNTEKIYLNRVRFSFADVPSSAECGWQRN